MTKAGQFLADNYTVKELEEMPIRRLKDIIRNVKLYIGKDD